MYFVQKYPKQIQIFNSVLIIVSIICNILALLENVRNHNIGIAVSDLMLLGALVCALIYMVKGHGKQTAGYFKATICLFLLGTIASVIVNAITTAPGEKTSLIGTVVIALIGTVLIAAVAFLPNLGKKKALTFSAVNLIMRTAIFVIVAVLLAVNPQAREKQGIAVIYRTLVLVTLSAVIYINTCYKYLDKEERHTN